MSAITPAVVEARTEKYLVEKMETVWQIDVSKKSLKESEAMKMTNIAKVCRQGLFSSMINSIF